MTGEPHERRPRWLVPSLSALTAVVISGCDLGLPSPITREGENVTRLWSVFTILALAIVALIIGLIVVVVIRYRRGHRDDIPSQRQYNFPLEITYTVIPLVIVGVLFGLTIPVQENLGSKEGAADVYVEVVGFQWQWQFRYFEDESYEGDPRIVVSGSPEQVPVLVLPVDATVRFRLVAQDVIHSFWVPEFLEKRDLIPGAETDVSPGIDNVVEVETTETGEWTGRCAEYCGLQHAYMDFELRVVDEAEWQSWSSEAADATGEEGT
ncbi:MAG: cytochrome c oxidase subunit 2 [Acidimicrobiales bacterium]|nr:cytochrome c oxidase subunit 2 [Acidimicrobiales bacterium]